MGQFFIIEGVNKSYNCLSENNSEKEPENEKGEKERESERERERERDEMSDRQFEKH